MALQYQFGLVEATDFALKLIHRLLRVCASEDVNALVIPELESFGQWLMVDGGRLSDGERALHASNNNARRVGRAVIGLTGDLAQDIFRENANLTASFIFIAGCDLLSTQRTGHLIHEIIRLRGKTAVGRQQVTAAVERIAGYKEFLPGDKPFQVYTDIMTGFSSQPADRRMPSICDDIDVPHLAELIFKIMDAFNNPENKAVLLTGSRMGIWLASFFVWLRPKEVDVCVNQARIYPAVTHVDEAPSGTRLTINLEPLRRSSSDVAAWKIQEWRAIPEKRPRDLIIDVTDSTTNSQQHRSPVQTTRMQLGAYIAPPLLEPIGTLATALVCIAAREGKVSFVGRSSNVVRLESICAENFLSTHTTAMAFFGWTTFDTQVLDRIIGSLAGAAERGDQSTSAITDPMGRLESIIRTAHRDCESHFGSSFLTPIENEVDKTTVIEMGVHLAAEALLFSLCKTRPANAVYRPNEPNILNQNARLLYQLAFGAPQYNASSGNSQEIYCMYSDLRNSAMKAMVQAAEDVTMSDLVVCVGGYAAYQSALGHLQSDIMADRRLAASISVCPGGLKLQGATENFRKLVEGQLIPGWAKRIPRPSGPRPVQLLAAQGGAFQGISDADALENGVSVEHLVHVSEQQVGTLQILSYLSKPGGDPARPEAMSRIPARWESSICAAIFAHHCEETYTIRHQLQELAGLWYRQGKLGENLQWCPVGMEAKGLQRCITTTHGDEALRFFEAGNLSFWSKPVYVRTGRMSLTYCVKQAMEEASEGWVLIS